MPELRIYFNHFNETEIEMQQLFEAWYLSSGKPWAKSELEGFKDGRYPSGNAQDAYEAFIAGYEAAIKFVAEGA